MTNDSSKRLESLDVLRGLDLFCLVFIGPVMFALARNIDAPWFQSVMWCFSHAEWEGFSPWDLVMPLFMFMAGVSMPFSLSKYIDASDKWPVYRRIIKRVALLWIFGMICQGNLLGLNPDKIYFYSNTLQAIAAGYLIAALLFLNTKPKVQITVAALLLITYWILMQFVSVGNYGGGNYTPDGNLAEWVDRTVLGRFRDRATVDESGAVIFAAKYRYTWVLSTLNFGVTVLTGLFAGQILRGGRTPARKTTILLVAGAAMVAAGWLWGIQMPVIKKIWTSSMTLVSSGYCFILLGVFYYLIDVRGWNRYTGWLKYYGMNSILAYMIAQVVSFDSVIRSFTYGFEQYMGVWYGVLLKLCSVTIIFFILRWLYNQKIFLRV